MGASTPPEVAEFVHHFNAGEYEESTLALITAWQLNASSFYKGLIQLAGAFQHWEGGNAFWAEDLFASAYNLLAPYAPDHAGLDIEKLLAGIAECNRIARAARESGAPRPEPDPMPRLQLVTRSG